MAAQHWSDTRRGRVPDEAGTHLPIASFSPLRAARAEPRTIGISSPGNLWARCGGGGASRPRLPPLPLGPCRRQVPLPGVEHTSTPSKQSKLAGPRLPGCSLVKGQQLSQLHLNQLHKLFVLHHVDLVQEADDGGDPHLQGREAVRAALWARASAWHGSPGLAANQQARDMQREVQGTRLDGACLAGQQLALLHGVQEKTGSVRSAHSAPVGPAGCAHASAASVRRWQTPPRWRHPSAQPVHRRLAEL